MKKIRLLCLTAAIVLSFSSFAGCADGSSSKTDSSSSQSSSSSKQETSSSASDSSEAKKPNAIGYDEKTSKRLYDNLKEKFTSSGYHAALKSSVSSNSEIFLNVKGEKVSSTNKNQSSNKTMIFTGGDTAKVYNHISKTYSEEKVSDSKKFVQQNDLIFGLAGDFIKAVVDEQNDIIIEYYKIRSDAAGAEGTISFFFKGDNGNFAQIMIEYNNQDYPILFGISEFKQCDDKEFELKENYKNYKKE